MKSIKFILYGFLVGALFAIFAGILFGAIPVLVIFGFRLDDPGQLLVMFGFAGLYSIAFAVLPGALGGAYLARWLEGADRAPHEIKRRSLLVGAMAGLAASLAFIGIVMQFGIDLMTFNFTVVAVIVAAGTSFLAARWLAKKKSKFIQPQP